MTGPEFNKALAALQSVGAIPSGRGSKTALAGILGVSRTTIYTFMRSGTDSVQTDYAIAAILADLDPYPKERLGKARTVVNRKEPT